MYIHILNSSDKIKFLLNLKLIGLLVVIWKTLRTYLAELGDNEEKNLDSCGRKYPIYKVLYRLLSQHLHTAPQKLRCYGSMYELDITN